MNKTVTNNLNFSLGKNNRLKFLDFITSITSFSKDSDDNSNIFSFSKKEIVCQNIETIEEEDVIKAYHLYIIEKNNIKEYNFETSENKLITIKIEHKALIKLRNLLKINNFEEIIFTAIFEQAKEKNCYFEVNFKLKDFGTNKEFIIFQGLTSIKDVKFFENNNCPYIQFDNCSDQLVAFVDMAKSFKEKNKNIKFTISRSDNEEDEKISLLLKVEHENCRMCFTNLDVKNLEKLDQNFNDFYLDTDELHRVLNSQKKSRSTGIFIKDDLLYFVFSYYEGNDGNDGNQVDGYCALTIVNVRIKQNVRDSF